MSDFEDCLGTDLLLLRNRRHQVDRDRGSDLSTVTTGGGATTDLATLTGVENIAQALLLRFLTHEGEMAALGHPTYGSRLHELIGEPNTEVNRNLAKLYTLKALAAEPRVEKVLSATVVQNAADRGAVDIDLKLKIIREDRPLNLVFPFVFTGGGAS